MAGMSAAAAPSLRRDPERGIIGGVAAGLARTMGIDPIIVRVGFVAASFAAGSGIVLYLVGWALLPAVGDDRAPLERLGRRELWLVVAGIVLLVLAALLLLRAMGLWFSDAIVWPVLLASAGGALIWRQTQTGSDPLSGGDADLLRPATREGSDPRRPALVGAALVVGGGLVFLWLNDALQPARDVLLAVFVVVVALTLILAPWWLRLVRGLTAERAERIRSQERAEVAAHLHDSVLQTLALVQKRAGDPREVMALARRQERELRDWLAGDGHRSPQSFAAALRTAAEKVEDDHRVAVEVVVVGDCELDERAEAGVG